VMVVRVAVGVEVVRWCWGDGGGNREMKVVVVVAVGVCGGGGSGGRVGGSCYLEDEVICCKQTPK